MSIVNRLEEKFLRLQLTGRMRMGLYRKFGRFLSNGMAPPQALKTMEGYASLDGKKKNAIQAVVLRAWLAKLNNGKPFSVAIEDWVPHSDRIVIEAGEKAGSLSEALENACLIQESSGKIKAAVFSGIAYPIVLFGAALGFLILFSVMVVPAFEAALPRDRWEGLGAQLGFMADFVKNGLVPTLVALGVLIAVIIYSLPRWTGPLRAKVDSFPGFALYRLVNGSGFLLSLAALTKAGVKVSSVLRTLQRSSTPWYAERISKTLAFVNEGKNIGDALYLTGLNFPDRETVNDLRSYAQLDSFDKELMNLGKQNLEETVTRIQAQAGIMRNVGIVLVAFVLFWCVGGVFSLQSQISAGL